MQFSYFGNHIKASFLPKISIVHSLMGFTVQNLGAWFLRWFHVMMMISFV